VPEAQAGPVEARAAQLDLECHWVVSAPLPTAPPTFLPPPTPWQPGPPTTIPGTFSWLYLSSLADPCTPSCTSLHGPCLLVWTQRSTPPSDGTGARVTRGGGGVRPVARANVPTPHMP
jgi:hypothetical protein